MTQLSAATRLSARQTALRGESEGVHPARVRRDQLGPDRLEPLLEMADRDDASGLEGMPYPPNHPKMADEPKRVQPSRARE